MEQRGEEQRAGERPAAIVFCERLDNESFCEAVVRELGAYYEVRPCGPGWPAAHPSELDPASARFYLELDAASGSFVRPQDLATLALPKLAWLIDTHKKPGFHRAISEEVDLTFFAMKRWGHVLAGERAWLPVHCDGALFRPEEREREWDVVFVGSQGWRADALRGIAARHGLRVHVTCTTGPREKSETAALYAKSKLVFNRHVADDLNFRTVEAMACGRVLLTDAQDNGQYDLFEEDRHYALYKDERDLERQLLRLLADEPLRARIEREAAALAQARHTTRARVAQLVTQLEAFLEARGVPSPPGAAEAARRAAWPPLASEPRRWLVLDTEPPAGGEERGYGALLAEQLAESGAEVVLVHPGRVRGAAPSARTHAVELELGPLPRAATEVSALLAQAPALQARLDDVSRGHGPFDAVLAAGALGALVGEALARRLGVPFRLALATCEVERRQNRLTRDQLYLAELEQRGVDAADEVLAASPAALEGARRHYRAAHVRHVSATTPATRRTA